MCLLDQTGRMGRWHVQVSSVTADGISFAENRSVTAGGGAYLEVQGLMRLAAQTGTPTPAPMVVAFMPGRSTFRSPLLMAHQQR